MHKLCKERAGEGEEEQRESVRVWTLAEAQDWLWQHCRPYLSDKLGQRVPWADRHVEFWQWVCSIRPGAIRPPFIGVWGRGGGKSSNAEMACNFLGSNRLRKYGLYVCGTQPQADDHIDTVATMFEQQGIMRAVGKYGQSKGWRRNRLRTEHFTLDAIGLDTAARGVKVDEARPDLMIFDDLDDQDDSEKVTLRKERDLTRKILPAASRDVAVLGIQNIPNAHGIFARLLDGRADYLMDRIVSGPFPALTDFDCERAENAEGKSYFRITSGVPTWAGQDLDACQALLNLIGKRSFEVESLHQTDKLLGAMFERQWFSIVEDWPRNARQVRFWDLASTEDTKPGADPDWTAGVKVAEMRGQYWIVDVQHFRATPKGVEDRIKQTAQLDGKGVEVWIEQEAGASGKNTIDHYQRTVLKGFTVYGMRSTGSKPERAKPVSSAAEAGNVFLVAGKWNAEYLDELEEFPSGLHDDMVDGTSGSVMVLSSHKPPPIIAPLGDTHDSAWRL